MKKIASLLMALLLVTAALILPVMAAEDTEFVYDWADILSDNEAQTLTSAAEEISGTYGVGVYIVTLPDMSDYGFYDIEECAEAFFNDMGLGLGSDHTGIMLIMSMAERDYDIDAHGDFAHYAFTDYGKTTISDEFLDNFRSNDWYGGFFDYLSQTEVLLRQADEGHPVDISAGEVIRGRITPAGFLCSAVVSALIAWLICSALKGKMKTARIAADADSYVQPGAVQITRREDRFTHTTETRRRIEKSERSGGGGGGTTISSGGHSHSSGKF